MNNEKIKKNVLYSGKSSKNTGTTIYNSGKVRIYMKKELKNSWVIYYSVNLIGTFRINDLKKADLWG